MSLAHLLPSECWEARFADRQFRKVDEALIQSDFGFRLHCHRAEIRFCRFLIGIRDRRPEDHVLLPVPTFDLWRVHHNGSTARRLEPPWPSAGGRLCFRGLHFALLLRRRNQGGLHRTGERHGRGENQTEGRGERDPGPGVAILIQHLSTPQEMIKDPRTVGRRDHHPPSDPMRSLWVPQCRKRVS